MKSAISLWMRRPDRLMPLLRVALFIALAAALTCVLLLREAHAQLDGLMLGLGSRVMAFPASPVTDSRTIRINGVGVELRTEIVEAPLSQVIGHYREVCATPPSAPSGFGSLIASIATRSGSTDRDGYVACVETGATDFETLVERLTAFSGTRNLADLGPVRYAYASRTAKRPDHETFLLTMWADASINLRDLLPPDQGDATGTDPEAIPRPRGARRILSAEESSAPSGVYVYVAEAEGPAELVRAYRHQLSDRGWGIIERNPGEAIQLNGAHILSAENGGRTLSVLTHAGDSSATTIVTLLVSEAE